MPFPFFFLPPYYHPPPAVVKHFAVRPRRGPRHTRPHGRSQPPGCGLPKALAGACIADAQRLDLPYGSLVLGSDASTEAIARWYSFFSSRSVMRHVLIIKLVKVRSGRASAPPCVHWAASSVNSSPAPAQKKQTLLPWSKILPETSIALDRFRVLRSRAIGPSWARSSLATSRFYRIMAPAAVSGFTLALSVNTAAAVDHRP